MPGYTIRSDAGAGGNGGMAAGATPTRLEGAIETVNAEAGFMAPQRHFGEAPDALEKLPSGKPSAILARLRERLSDLSDAYAATMPKWNDAREALYRAKGEYDVLTDPSVAAHRNKKALPLDDERSKTAKRALDKAREAFDKVQARRDAISDRMQPLRRLIDRCEKYLETAPARALKEAPAPTGLKLPTVDKLESAIASAREAVAEVLADRHEIDSAAWPSSEIRKRAIAEIDALAAAGRPNLVRLVDHGPKEGVPWSSARIKISAPSATASRFLAIRSTTSASPVTRTAAPSPRSHGSSATSSCRRSTTSSRRRPKTTRP